MRILKTEGGVEVRDLSRASQKTEKERLEEGTKFEEVRKGLICVAHHQSRIPFFGMTRG